MQQRDFTTDFRDALASGALPPGVTAARAAEAAQRFAVYRNNVAHSLGRALASRYLVVERLVGRDFFAAMAPEFIAAHPPTSPVLAEWGGDFAAFLESFPPVASLPYLADVARIEWARGRAYHAADAGPADPATLSEQHPLRLHPSLCILRLGHPAVSIWTANQPDCDGRTTAQGAEIALIWRAADFTVPVRAIASADAALLTLLQAGVPLNRAAVDVDPTRMLALLLDQSLICEDA